MLAGENSAFGIAANQVSDRFLSELISRLASGGTALDQADPDHLLREMLHIAAVRFRLRFMEEERRLADTWQFRPQARLVEVDHTRGGSSVETLFDRPFLLVPRLLILNAGAGGFVLDRHAVDFQSPAFHEFFRLLGLTLSGLEHELWEEIALKPGCSTVKGLQMANEQAIPIVTFDSSNAAQEIAKLGNIPDGEKRFMQTLVDQGQTVTTPVRLIDFGGANWASYIAEFPDGRGFYFINYFDSIAPSTRARGGGASMEPALPWNVQALILGLGIFSLVDELRGNPVLGLPGNELPEPRHNQQREHVASVRRRGNR